MVYSQKYALMYFIDSVDDGAQFRMSEWPLHVTIADVFAINRSETAIDRKLKTLLFSIPPVETTVLDQGELGSTPVMLIKKTPALQELHAEIVSLLSDNDAVFNNPEFTREGFLPHSTVQKNARLKSGDKILIGSLSLIDMFPNGDWEQRKVLNTFVLKG